MQRFIHIFKYRLRSEQWTMPSTIVLPATHLSLTPGKNFGWMGGGGHDWPCYGAAVLGETRRSGDLDIIWWSFGDRVSCYSVSGDGGWPVVWMWFHGVTCLLVRVLPSWIVWRGEAGRSSGMSCRGWYRGGEFCSALEGRGSPWCTRTIQYLYCSGGGMFFYLFYISFILGANQPVAKMLGSHY